MQFIILRVQNDNNNGGGKSSNCVRFMRHNGHDGHAENG